MHQPSVELARRGFVLCLALYGLFLTRAAVAESGQDSAPNILIITADNIGYGDLRCFNSESPILTPNLDRLASDGARLTCFYTASPTCTVSRASLLTGRVPQRHGLTNQLPGLEGNYGRGLDPTELLIPQHLKLAGYATGCFGKWNIGFAPGSRPTERGFDTFFGHASGNIDYYTHVYNGKHDMYRGIEEAHVPGYSTDLFADAAIEFIEEQTQAERKWFCYLPFNAPHFPNPRNKQPGEPAVWQAPAAAFEAYGYDPGTSDKRQGYQAVITALDSAIGRVLDSLDRLALRDRTFVFFYSDNGAFMLENRGLEVASNAPLREGGVTCFEGGVRVAAIARWPGRIAANATIDEPLWSPDLFVGCQELASVDAPAGVKLDGKNPLPVLTEGARSPHASFYFRFRRHAALRQGDWKIVRTKPDEPWMLFNLADDIGESSDLAQQLPNRRDALAKRFEQWEAEIADDRSRRVSEFETPVDGSDPLRPLLRPELTPLVDVVLDNYRGNRKYDDSQFPLPPDEYAAFQREVIDRFVATLQLEDWTVRSPEGKLSPIADRFLDRLVRTVKSNGVVLEVHAVRFPESGLVVPMVVCLPDGDDVVPGVCVFSGHSKHGLRDLVLDLDSYQRGVAVRLAQAGLASIAVEKIDTGYLSRDGVSGVDENPVALTLLHWGPVTRAHQLRACLAASEILATHPRVDPARIGATGVSLGGWLSIQTALLSDRITAVADFGRKTMTIPPDVTADEFKGPADLCHILPGMLSLCDRNLLALAYCPRPLLAGHGRRDAGSDREGPLHFERVFAEQYAALGKDAEFEYHVHNGGDDMPAEKVVRWFRGRFGVAE